MKSLTIGEVARRAGVGIETVRFYEREGLLAKPARTPSGYRQYGEEVIARLRFIRRAKELGFTLKEIKELLELWLDPASNCHQVRQRAERKIAGIEAKLKQLRAMKRALVGLVDACAQGRPSGGCPILDTLEETEG